MAPKSKEQMIPMVVRATLVLTLAMSLMACVEGKERPDGALPADAPPATTFDLKATLIMIPSATLTCNAADKKADCQGNLYWSLFDKPITNFADAPPLRAGTVKSARNGTTFTAKSLPLKKQLYLGAFLDDDDNMVLTSPLPDKGDPVFFSMAAFSPAAGSVYAYNITFLLRMW